MKDWKNTLILSLAAVAAVAVVALVYFNRSKADDIINVTGLGSVDFESDRISWKASINAYDGNLQSAFNALKQSRAVVLEYLQGEKISDSETTLGPVEIIKENKQVYSGTGEFIGESFFRYRLTQEIRIESTDIDRIEKVSRNVTELINKGVEVYSEAPDYFFTRLADLKLELIAKATADARERAVKVTRNAGSKLGKLRYSNIGIFQITERNSSGEVSWEGEYNTKARYKTANVTVKVQYQLR